MLSLGDGLTDDTAAINKATSDGGRCGADCGSSTIYPAVVYFPPWNVSCQLAHRAVLQHGISGGCKSFQFGF